MKKSSLTEEQIVGIPQRTDARLATVGAISDPEFAVAEAMLRRFRRDL